MKQIGIFSGSFNPIHIGHLALANWICAYEEVDEVWFLITPQNPLKKLDTLISDQIRLEMVNAAIDGYPCFKASDFEFHLPRPTYTIDTLKALEKTYPDCCFSFIMGADNWINVSRWKDHETLLSDYPILIYPRPGFPVDISETNEHIRLMNAPLMEISSTFIRDSVEKGIDIRFFLPEKVRPYFYK